MLRVMLLNFGDNTRVVHDRHQRPRVINIGDALDVELDNGTVRMIRRGQDRGDTLIMVPIGTDVPPDLARCAEVLRNVADSDYAEVLEAVNSICGADPNDLRPTRDMMRYRLREYARKSCDALKETLPLDRPELPEEPKDEVTALPNLRDDVDPRTLRKEYEDANKGKAPDAPKDAPKDEPKGKGRRAGARNSKPGKRAKDTAKGVRRASL